MKAARPYRFDGAAMRSDRENAGLTRRVLAAIVGVTEKTLQNWENGYTTPRIGDVLALEDAINEALLSGKVPVTWRTWWVSNDPA